MCRTVRRGGPHRVGPGPVGGGASLRLRTFRACCGAVALQVACACACALDNARLTGSTCLFPYLVGIRRTTCSIKRLFHKPVQAAGFERARADTTRHLISAHADYYLSFLLFFYFRRVGYTSPKFSSPPTPFTY